MPQYSIVIARLPADRLEAAAEALGEALGIGAAAARPVLQTLPTVLFSGLDYQQARRVARVLSALSAAGAAVLLAEGDGGGVPQVKWPAEPVLAGRPLSSYRTAAGAARCPVCGAALRAEVHLEEETGTAADGLPLPDVPQLPREAPRTPGGAGRSAGGSLDLAEVEKVWKERASRSGIHGAVRAPADAAGGRSPSAVLDAVDREVPSLEPSPSGQYDVFVGRSSHPELPALIAEARGLSLEEAGRIARKTIIPVAKAVDERTALRVKKKLEGMNLKPKVVPRRKSSGELPPRSPS